MRLLTVDYDQGAGGEWFARVLSQSPECCPLDHLIFNTRTKVFDVLDQQLLKNTPDWKMIQHRLQSVDFQKYRFHVVPCHRKTQWIKQHLPMVSSIRIQMPTNPQVLLYVRYLQIHKALLAVEPNDWYFLGLVRDLQRDYGHPQFIRRVHRRLDNLSLLLLANGVEDDQESRRKYLTNLVCSDPEPEPCCDFDAIIPYEDLLFRPDSVGQQIRENLGLELDLAPFKEFQENYHQWTKQMKSLSDNNDPALEQLILTHKANYEYVINNA